MKKSHLTLVILFFIATLEALAQNNQPTSATTRLNSFEKHQMMGDTSLLFDIPLTNIGPTVMSGRVTDIAVQPDDPTHFYVSYASGSVWYTHNNGSTFTPIFDDEATPTIGDIAVDWERNILYVGTGENNSSRSSYAGTGIYKSTDMGKTWEHLGLSDSHHTGRIILHPTNPNILWVAALGHLYSPNTERGVFKTTDGGKTWERTLYIDEYTGAIDLILDPNNPNILYAAMWHRERYPWNFVESGSTSGIYKSMDAGNTWQLLSTPESGFPTGEGVGRIGLDLFDSNTLFAIVDNQFRRKSEDDVASEGLTRDKLRNMSKRAFLNLDKKEVVAYLEQEGFPDIYSFEVVTKMIQNDEILPVALVEFVEDANQLLFNTPVIGAEVYRSDDAGKTWTKTNEDSIQNLYNSYGYYFGEIRISPHDKNKVYILGVPILRSDDGGVSFNSISGANVHADHQALWINPKREGHLIDGNDGGLNISYDDGASWFKLNSPSVGQFYDVTYDMAEPFNVYGGLQDNGVWVGPSTYTASDRWHASGQYPYSSLGGGDGMQTQVDFRDNQTIYTGSQFGFYTRQNRATGDRGFLRPQHKLGERPLRYNWETPIHLSRHNQDILYMGANKLFRSMNKGVDFVAISGELTKGGKPGDVPFGTLTTIDESPLQFGLLYVGSDDGLVHVSKDGGASWQLISSSLPQDFWVAHIEASNHNLSTVYVALNGYRNDIFEPMVYKSNDYGNTWISIGDNLPKEPVNVVIEDPSNPNLLYVGTDLGIYVSLDGGNTFNSLNKDFPNTPVHDLEVHPRDKKLIVGTHGRSIYLADISLLQQLTNEILSAPLFVYDIPSITHNPRWGMKRGNDFIKASAPLNIYVSKAGTANISVRDKDNKILKEWRSPVKKGINLLEYDLTQNKGESVADDGKYYLPVGKYTVQVSINGTTESSTLELKEARRR